MKLIKLIYWTVQGYVDAKMGVPNRTVNVIMPARLQLAYANAFNTGKEV